MKHRTLVFFACLGILGLHTLAAQDEPKHREAGSSKKKARASEDDEPQVKKTTPKTDGDSAGKSETKPGEAAAKPHEQHPAAVSTIASDELAGFDEYPAELQVLIEKALALTRLNLPYIFGGSSPEEGGMDCSGTLYYLLTQHGMKGVPRSSDEICQWVRERSGLHLAPDGVELSHDAFSALRPGDLLFWTGTYETLPRKLPVSHIMMYLGTVKKTGRPVVFGASDGRYYGGQRRSGVSVFDFNMPRSGSKAAFFGYGTIPGMSRARTQEEVRKALPPPVHEIAAVAKPETKDRGDDPTPEPIKKQKAAASGDDPPAHKQKRKSAEDSVVVAKVDAGASRTKETTSVAEDDRPAVRKRKQGDSDDEPPSPRKTPSHVADADKVASADADAPKKKGRSSSAEGDPPKTEEKVKTSETVAKTDDDAPKKEPAPHKPATHRKSAVKRKAASDDVDPGAVVRKAVNSIRKAFE